MAKKLYKEKQRFQGWEVIGMLSFFMIGLSFQFVKQHWIEPVSDPMRISTYLIFMIPLAALTWYLVNLRLSVKVTAKSISFKYSPFTSRKHKIRWNEVEECEVVNSSETARMSGWDISFNHEKRYSLNGRKGLYLKLKDGDHYVIGSHNINGLKNAIGQIM